MSTCVNDVTDSQSACLLSSFYLIESFVVYKLLTTHKVGNLIHLHGSTYRWVGGGVVGDVVR